MTKAKLVAAMRAVFRFFNPIVQKALAVLLVEWIKSHVPGF